MFTEGFGRYVCQDDSIVCKAEGFKITAHVERDGDMGEPWKEHDGHGPVSDWTQRDKAPGERVLCAEGYSKRFYDFAGAVKIAKRDGWGPPVEGETPGQQAARAAEADFRVLKAWCEDDWYWCGIVLTVERAGVELGTASLWGIEANYPDSDNSYLLEVANELIPEAIANAKVTLAKLCVAA